MTSEDKSEMSAKSNRYMDRSRVRRRNQNRDQDHPYYMETSESASLVLVAEALNEHNYITWGRAMMRAFKSRGKLKFLIGEVRGADDYDRWEKVNATLICWILNTISTKLTRGFMFDDDMYALWSEIKERSGESNGPLLHRLRRDISKIKQGKEFVSVYFTQLKSLWDEFSCLRPRKRCSAGCVNYYCFPAEEVEKRLSQFFMGLNDEYGVITQQILVMDPPQTVNKACSMVTRVERQIHEHDDFHESQQNAAMAVRVYRENMQQRDAVNERQDEANAVRMKDMNVRRPYMMCEFCGKPGHLKADCYQIKGYPKWRDFTKERDQSYRGHQSNKPQYGSSSRSQRSRYYGSSSPSHRPQYGAQYGGQGQYGEQRNQYGAQRPVRGLFHGQTSQKHVAHAVVEEDSPMYSYGASSSSFGDDEENKLQAMIAKMIEAQLDKKQKGKEVMQDQGQSNNYSHS